MKTRHRFLSMMLCIAFVISMLPMSVFATDNTSGLDNFEKFRNFTSSTFTDVTPDDWFYDNVKTAYQFGLMVGNSATTFNPNGNVTIVESIAVAARLHSIYHTGNENFVQSEPWYQTYVEYALANNIITSTYDDYSVVATRAEYAVILAAAVPDSALPEINNVTDNAIPDVNIDDTYGAAAYKLYRAGILVGSDAAGSFRPTSNIMRSEVAAIVSRMADVSLRISFNLGNEYDYTVTFVNGLQAKTQTVLAGKCVDAPAEPNKSGFSFEGWYTAETGGTKFDFSTPITGDVSLYARWVMDGEEDTVLPDLMNQAMDLGGDTSKLTNMPTKAYGEGYFQDYMDLMESPLDSATYAFDMSAPATEIGADASGLTAFAKHAQQSYGTDVDASYTSAATLDAALEALFAVAGTTDGLDAAKAAAADINPELIPALVEYISALAQAQSLNQEAIMDLLTSQATISYKAVDLFNAGKITVTDPTNDIAKAYTAGGGSNVLFQANEIGNACSVQFEVPKDGVYYMSLTMYQYKPHGKFQMYVDNVPYGSVYNGWNHERSNFVKIEHILGNISLTEGTHTLKMILVHEGEGTTPQKIGVLDTITLAPQDTSFVKKLNASEVWDSFQSGSDVNKPSYYNGSGITAMAYKAADIGDWCSWSFNVDEAGTYDLSLSLMRYGAYGQYQVYVDGGTYGDVYDGYMVGYTSSKAPVLATHSLGAVPLSAGTHTLKFECVGKNPSATGLFIALGFIDIRKTESTPEPSPTVNYGDYSTAAETFNTLQKFTYCQAAVSSNTVANTAYKMQSQVDQAKLRASGMVALEATEALTAVAKRLTSFTVSGNALTMNTPFGAIILGTSGDDSYTDPEAMLLMDPSGNDTYNGKVAASLAYNKPIGVLIDVAGNDTYTADNMAGATQGSGIMGTGILFDLAGDDTYTAVRLSQAYALLGTGILFEGNGTDKYTIDVSGQSAALYGFATLADISGNDTYRALAHAQASASNRSMAFLVDTDGNDTYYVEPDKQGSYAGLSYSDYPDKNGNWSQGCGFGNRAIVSGGISGGIAGLIDLQGSDTYTGGIWVMGVGYWSGIGYLLDTDGNDVYTSCYYSQASTAHYGVGILNDIGGDDVHTLTRSNYKESAPASGASIGCVYDHGIGTFINDGGNDSYSGYQTYCGVAWTWKATNMDADTRVQTLHYAFFIDTEGDDTYGGTYSKRGFGYGNGGFFIDGGGTDTYTGTYTGITDGGEYTDDAERDSGIAIDYDGNLPVFRAYELAKETFLA